MNLQLPQVSLVVVNADHTGQRIDNFLLARLKGVPKSYIYRILRKGDVRVNKKRIRPDYKLAENDVIRVPPVRVAEKNAAPVPVQIDRVKQLECHILYEDDDLLAINKPSGMAVHGGSEVSFGVIEAFRALRPKACFLELVHRIDKETSGILIIAKKRSVLHELHKQFRLKQVQKDYLALVRGIWPSSCKMVSVPLLKNHLKSGERVVKVNNEGKYSQTRFMVEERFAFATLINASPVTGRTHQIRVHTQYEGHPIALDRRYGDRAFDEKLGFTGIKRLFLHAVRLQLIHPRTEQKMTLTAPMDENLKECLQKLREQKGKGNFL